MDASGGTTEVDANSKFNTNIPFNQYMFITEVDWVFNVLKHPIMSGVATGVGEWTVGVQLTEALARTIPTFTDPVYVAEDAWEWDSSIIQSTAAGILNRGFERGQVFWRHVLANPWATAAQQLNIVGNDKTLAVGTVTNGASVTLAAVIEYQLFPLSATVRAYLAQRVQIAGQA